MKDGKCIVKGIVFFGTPFQGSRVADFVTYSEGLVDFLEADKELLKSLRMNNNELNEITGRIKQIRQVHGIRILIYYESQPLLIKKLFGFRVGGPSIAIILANICDRSHQLSLPRGRSGPDSLPKHSMPITGR